MPLYQFSCECGRSIAISTSQAGQSVTCECGKRNAVPSLRAIRALPVASESTAKAANRTDGTWNPAKGTLFAAGALLTLVGLSMTAYYFWVYREVSKFTSQGITYSSEVTSYEVEKIDKLNAIEMLDAWDHFTKAGIGHSDSSPLVHGNRESRRVKGNLMLTIGVALVGCVLIGVSTVLPTNSKR